MFNSTDFDSFNSMSGGSRLYKTKNIKDWDGEDCLAWAYDIEQALSIPISCCVHIGDFGRISGRDLRRYKEADFRRIVNDQYGPLFYAAFRKLVKEQREDNASSKQPYQAQDYGITSLDCSSDFSDNSNWTVPQLRYDLEVPTTNNSTFGLAYPGSSPCFSPFTLGVDDSWISREPPSSPTYFTQPAIMSGGSLSFGNCSSSGGLLLSPSDSSLESSSEPTSYPQLDPFAGSPGYNYEEGYPSSLLPDIDSLMIKDVETISDKLNIAELDSTFRDEEFTSLDHYLHGEATGMAGPAFPLPDEEGAVGGHRSESDISHLFVSNTEDSLEESMLKKITTGRKGNRVRHPQSWEFLVRLLMSPQTNPSLIKWEDKDRGIFRLVQKEKIAQIWGKRSQKHRNEPLAYDNFARILRYHYRSEVLLPVSDKHLVYKFGDKILKSLKKNGMNI